ncbi:MAG: electron transfer flavoprotein subunit beta/FixA family protein [Dehalococcoidales bacterium]|nr:electron transfer flavoprotein subunit beta/FixA family protein [Dehalococcoidales bacterium]
MKVVVCIKQVMDPEAPPSSFKIDSGGSSVVLPASISPVLDLYSEYALEAALKIKDASNAQVIAVSLGVNLQRDVIKKPLSMGADDLILLEDEAFADSDSWTTAYALAMAIKKINDYGLILCGRQSADWGNGQVGLIIAEILGLPVVTMVRKIDVSDKKTIIERTFEDGYEVVEVPLPCVLIVSNEIGEPRYPNIRGIMAAKKKEVIAWKPSDIKLEASQIGFSGRRNNLSRLFQPVRNSKCELITGDTPEETALNLATKLRENKLL